jgi:1,4-alpha-glucan branching enzyme
MKDRLDENGGLIGYASHAYTYFGLNRGESLGKPGVWYREWAPGAQALALVGEFNGWDREANPLERDQWGVWSTFLSDDIYGNRLVHGGLVKVHVIAGAGGQDRLPAYARRVVQDADEHFSAQYWHPAEEYMWQHAKPNTRGGLRIYEAHVGMAQEVGRVGSYVEFAQFILPRIARLGYNAVQLMAVMEHPYYGSFGYHVSNFFAASSRFGTPEELKQLIDKAHSLGLRVIMDLVHSHSVKNIQEGLNGFDGTDHQYFHAGARGDHSAWDSLTFDYSKYEVQRFLLSNVRFWLSEYHFDGFRFDGVTSMLYLDHGLGRHFSSYDDYFNSNVDRDAVAYLMLANELIHSVSSDAITVAEDVSGMPGMARPVGEGGLGFDYRLAMGLPDFWIKLLKEKRDEDWNLEELYHTLLNRRSHEKHIAYAESHDQALVGDKTLAFRLMDAEMYTGMRCDSQSLVIARGIALLKIIRLFTFSLGGEGYLNFMGNEFGHPEWIDFPRVGNGYSYHYARRQWSLVDNDELLYKGLNAFDTSLQTLDVAYNLLEDPLIEQLALHQDTHQLVYRRGPLIFAVNLNPTESFTDLRIPVCDPADYRVVLNTDEIQFDGGGLVEPGVMYPLQHTPMYGREHSIQIYLPARSAQVLAPIRR